MSTIVNRLGLTSRVFTRKAKNTTKLVKKSYQPRRLSTLTSINTSTSTSNRRFGNTYAPLHTSKRPFSIISCEWGEKMAQIQEKSGEEVSSEQIASFYDEWSKDYDKHFLDYGWIGPSMCVKILNEYINMANYKSNKNSYILDCGCGTGLVGQALYNDGFHKLIGCDISEKSLKICEDKGVYKKTFSADLEDLVVPGEVSVLNGYTFNTIVCLGVLSHVNNKSKLFLKWTELIENDGIIVVSHREDFMQEDLKYFEEMEKSGHWQRLFLSEPFSHNPNLKSFGSKIKAHFYVAKVNKYNHHLTH